MEVEQFINQANTILILDDLVSSENANLIEKELLDNDFPWYYNDKTVDVEYNTKIFNEDVFEGVQFTHNFVNEENSNHVSNKISTAEKLIGALQEHFDLLFHFKRIKANLQFKISTKKLYNTPHIDTDKNHVVIIYYANDSDGCTFIFENDTIKKKVESKKGRFLIFNGSQYYHAGMHPKISDKRLVINFNVIDAEKYV
jgi:hypothetical protein